MLRERFRSYQQNLAGIAIAKGTFYHVEQFGKMGLFPTYGDK